MIALLLVLIMIALAVASYFGATADSRDSDYTLSHVFERRNTA
ncbi:MAG: hypothetical protein ABI808_06100 [Pseudonocardiales bacterium]